MIRLLAVPSCRSDLFPRKDANNVEPVKHHPKARSSVRIRRFRDADDCTESPLQFRPVGTSDDPNLCVEVKRIFHDSFLEQACPEALHGLLVSEDCPAPAVRDAPLIHSLPNRSPSRDLAIRHAYHATPIRPHNPPSLVIGIRSHSQFRTTPERDKQIPSASHLSRGNRIVHETHQLGSSSTWGFRIEQHKIPTGCLNACICLHTHLVIFPQGAVHSESTRVRCSLCDPVATMSFTALNISRAPGFRIITKSEQTKYPPFKNSPVRDHLSRILPTST